MSFRDLSAALERVQRLQDENAELRAHASRPIDWLNVYVFGVVVAALTSVILVGSRLMNAT